MEIVTETLTQTTRMKPIIISSEKVGEALERAGWLRDVAGDEDFEKACKAISMALERGRGLFVTGRAGCGKTALIKAMKRWGNRGEDNWFYCKSKDDLEFLRYAPEPYGMNVYLDDIGCEEILKDYGNTIDIIGDFVQRYHARSKFRFIATTNLDSQKLNERYGTRVLDRIAEMCVILKLSGKTKRESMVVQ